MEEEFRFSGKLGTEYELFTKAHPHYIDFQKAITKAIKKDKGAEFEALEIGTGPGETTEIFATNFIRAKIICVDNEIAMLKQAKRKLEKFGKRISFIQSDALKYLRALESNSKEVFFSGFTLHNFDQKYRLECLRELFRILKRGGIFVNGDKYALNDVQERYKAFNWSIQRYLEFYPKSGRNDLCYDWIVHMGDDEKPNKIMVESESIEKMKEIGYKKIGITYRKHMEAVLFAEK